MGRVWETPDGSAVKVIHPSVVELLGIEERLRVHAISPPRIDHPLIHQLRSIDWRGGEYRLIMDRVDGSPAVPRPPEVAAVEFARVLEAFAAAHRRGFVHGDIKPGNFLVLPDGSLRIMDFYLSRILGVSPTTSGLLGMPKYLSPEQAKGEPLDARSDVYSLGKLLLDMVNRVPSGLGEVVERATELEPNRRYRGADEFRAALLEWMEREAPPSVSVAAPQAAQEAVVRKAQPLSLRAGLCIAGGAAVGAWLLLHGGSGGQKTVEPAKPVESPVAAPVVQVVKPPVVAAARPIPPQPAPPAPKVPRKFVPPADRTTSGSVEVATQPLPPPPAPLVRGVPTSSYAVGQLPALPPPPEPDRPTPAVAAPVPAKAAPANPPPTREAHLLTVTPPQYPPIAIQRGISGKVRLQAEVAADGSVRNVKTLGGSAVLADAAMKAVRNWVYQPATVDSRPVPSTVQIEIVFTPPSQKFE